jgi:hypothetical protein
VKNSILGAALALVVTSTGCSGIRQSYFSATSSATNATSQIYGNKDLGDYHARMRLPRLSPAPLPAPILEHSSEIQRSMVQREIKHLLKGDPDCITRGLQRRREHYPVLRAIFEDEAIPPELINLALIESGFDTHARSGVGAVGMWQFMRPTARQYGLQVGLLRDERKDPILSTIAAARYLRDLYQMFDDWHLALAAYNAGPGAVLRAMKRSGLTDFWSLARKRQLPLQTVRFVPRFIAAALIVGSPENFGIDLALLDQPSGSAERKSIG